MIAIKRLEVISAVFKFGDTAYVRDFTGVEVFQFFVFLVDLLNAVCARNCVCYDFDAVNNFIGHRL